MPDIREQIRRAAPQVPALDMAAVQARAEQLRAADRHRTRAVFAGVAVGLCLLLAGVVVTADTPTTDDEVAVSMATTSPQAAADAIRGPLPQGGQLGIADFDGRPLILFGWAEGCDWCVRDGLPLLAGTVDQLEVGVVGLAVDTTATHARDALQTTGVDLPTILVTRAQLSTLLPDGLDATVPVWVALNAEHEVVDTIVGPMPGALRLRTMSDRARTRTDPDPAATVVAIPDPTGDGILAEPSSAAPVPPSDPHCTAVDRLYEVQPGDSLSSIAAVVYGDPTQVGPIAEANGLTGDAPLPGRTLRIPVCAPPGQSDTAFPTATLDRDLQQALIDTLPEGWDSRPTDVRDGLAFGDAHGGVVIRQPPVPDTATPQSMIQQAIAQGADPLRLADGATAALTSPDDTGRLLVPLPGGRLIELSGEGDLATTTPEVVTTLRQWMVAVRARLT